jgi:hypothetical protein
VARVGLPLLAVVVLLAAGCGGKTSYSLPKTRSCLQARGAQVTPPARSDIVATSAVGGSFKALLGDNFVTLVFGTDEGSGQNLADAYARFAFPNVRTGLPDVLRRYSNVVTLWHEHPQDADLSLVVGCLR